MHISQGQLDEFKEIFWQEFGVEISDKEAQKKATNLISLMKALLKHKYEMAQKKTA